MKKVSSKHRRKRSAQQSIQQPKQQTQNTSRYPTKDNVYDLRQARQYQQEGSRRRESGQAPVPSRQPKQTPPVGGAGRKRQGRRINRALPLFVFVVVALYLCGQMLNMVLKKTDINVETVAYGTVDTPQQYTGLIVRDEYVVNSSRSGQSFYRYTEGDYVPKNAVVCTVKDTGTTDDLEDKLNKIDKDILKSQKNRTDLSAFSEDIARIEDSITRTVDAYAGRGMKTDMSYLYTLQSQVRTSMNQRNEIWLTENVESLSQLTDEKDVYEQQLAQSMSSVKNQASGVFSLSYDGLEETLTPAALEDITKAQIGDGKTQYISKAKTVVEEEPLFKIVSSNQWYVVAYLPNNSVVNWKKDDEQVLDIVTEEETIQVTAKIESIEMGEKEAKMVFSSYEKMEDFVDKRTISFHMDSETVQGLKVPNNAIVEKSLLTIPRECITESVGNQGVLLANGDKSKFISISVVSADEASVYIEQGGELKLGDVILKGTGETATQTTVSELKPMTGVYIANSSMAKFVIVEILDQNQEYAIIRSGTTYGLQAYDTIVSDAKNITEGQSIY